ncbi:hypothetical protein L226DRAFT_309414 [Lentinus tigrinus ALCF2SS1-7]|uniref:Uncharacterized protein n=1 Tax=Lentinus tigrinus ALCF2SS1-6 TaxID=1328759 RepID=A0A5C2S2P1_9APHY|nr:hypothetical protein L227DRAFT_529537 [Lentinus tigrinus ALCF2SS1-6]RPD69034.1 hypothetical protein L226DRAFT_309414 [Lentinus tigrinus ALCF2SS1-7]
MLFKSAGDAGAQASHELIIFCHAQSRVLLPLPRSYEEAQRLARDQFSLSGELVFESDELLEGSHVRIHPLAWPGICSVLRSVTVKSATVQPPAPVARPRPSEALNSGSRRMSSQKRMSVVGATPLRLSNGTVISAVPAVERQSLSARKAPVLSPSPRPSSIIFSHKEPGPSGVRSPPSVRNVATPPPTSKIEELDEEEEEIRILSPTKKRSARPRIMSDYGIEEPEPEDDGSANDTRRLDASDDEEFDQLEDSELASTSASKLPVSRSRNSNTSLVELDREPSASGARKATRSSPVRNLDAPLEQPKIKAEKTRATPDAVSQSSQPSQSQPKTDESFLIMIEYSDDPESRSLFKTRGRHMVSKVLMQACRTFGLDDYYRSARLVLLVEEADEDGEIVYQRRYVCNRDETMGEAGAEPNSKFIVELVYENDDEDDE